MMEIQCITMLCQIDIPILLLLGKPHQQLETRGKMNKSSPFDIEVRNNIFTKCDVFCHFSKANIPNHYP